MAPRTRSLRSPDFPQPWPPGQPPSRPWLTWLSLSFIRFAFRRAPQFGRVPITGPISKDVKVGSVSGKGLGMLSMRKISPGTILYSEKPLYWFRKWKTLPTFWQILPAWRLMKLSSQNQARLMTLSEGREKSASPLEKVLNIHLANAFDWTAPYPLLPKSLTAPNNASAVFFNLSRLNHSCSPNAEYMPAGWGRMRLVSTRPIGQGEEITVPYNDMLDVMIRQERSAYLMHNWGFFCTCEACRVLNATPSDDRRLLLKRLHYDFVGAPVPEIPIVHTQNGPQKLPVALPAPPPKMVLRGTQTLNPTSLKQLRRETKARWEEGFCGSNMLRQLTSHMAVENFTYNQHVSSGHMKQLGNPVTYREVRPRILRARYACMMLASALPVSSVRERLFRWMAIWIVRQRIRTTRDDVVRDHPEAWQIISDMIEAWPPSLDERAWTSNPVDDLPGIGAVATKAQRKNDLFVRQAGEDVMSWRRGQGRSMKHK